MNVFLLNYEFDSLKFTSPKTTQERHLMTKKLTHLDRKI